MGFQVTASLYVAISNYYDEHGHNSVIFAALWSGAVLVAFNMILIEVLPIFARPMSEFVVGCLIGGFGMISELFFVLMVMFFILGMEAARNGYGNLA